MFPCFYYDNASQRISFPSAEKFRVRDGWYPQLCRMGEMIWELEFFPPHSFSFFLSCHVEGQTLGPLEARPKLYFWTQLAGVILILHWLYTFLQWQPVPLSPSASQLHPWLSLLLMKNSVLTRGHVFDCLSIYLSFPRVLFSILFVIMTWCP